jgi:hypothetical protein
MSEKISVSRIQRRCFFRTRDSLRRALSASYIADVTMGSNAGELTVRSLPAALFLLNVVEECALVDLTTCRQVKWTVPETDADILISTLEGLLEITPLFEGSGATGRSFRSPLKRGMILFYNELSKLILSDRQEFERLSPFVADNPVIRRIFDLRYT